MVIFHPRRKHEFLPTVAVCTPALANLLAGVAGSSPPPQQFASASTPMKSATSSKCVVACSSVGFFLLWTAAASAQVSDPTAAGAQLQQGYNLKQQGNCEEAIPHFLESVRLDRHPKALVNLADCEERLGRLGAAQSHFVEARELASAQGLEPLWKVAEQQQFVGAMVRVTGTEV